MTTIAQAVERITEVYGPNTTAAREAGHAAERYADEIVTYLESLPALDDRAFIDSAADVIYRSTTCVRFNGFEHAHAQCSIAFEEARRRHRAAGHTVECRATPLYDRAHGIVMREMGARPSPISRCTCGKDAA